MNVFSIYTHTPSRFAPLALGAGLALASGCGEVEGETLESEDPYTQMADATLVASIGAQPLIADEDRDLRRSESCTLEARPAGIIRVFMDAGDGVQPVPEDARILVRRWSVEQGWGPIEEAACGDESCTTASFGYGQPGTYLVGAFACGDATITGVEVGETADGCHVDTVYLPLVLDAPSMYCLGATQIDTPAAQGEVPGTSSAWILDDEPCSVELLRPAVVVNTGVIDGDLVWPKQPQSVLSERVGVTRERPMQCVDESCTTFVAGWGATGVFELSADLCGERVSETVEVEPTKDGCNVATEWVGLNVDAGRCSPGVQTFDQPQ